MRKSDGFNGDEMETENKVFKQAHERDNGKYATMGMMYQCSSYLDIDIHSDQVSEIVERYLDSITYCTFFEYLRSKEVYKYLEKGVW